MFKLSGSPFALLGALEAKINGRNPAGFAEELVPVFDVFDQYLAERTFITLQTATATAPAQTASVAATPATGIVWRVIGIGTVLTLGTADVALTTAVNVYVRDPGGNTCPVQNSIVLGGGTNRTVRVSGPGGGIKFPFWLPPGWSIAADASLSAASTANWTLQVNPLVNRIEQ